MIYMLFSCVFPLNAQAAETWDEFVTVSAFNIQPVCWYMGETSLHDKNAVRLGLRGERRRRIYAFHIKSQYKLFHNYGKGGQDGLTLTTELYNITAYNYMKWRNSMSKEDRQLTANMLNNKEDFYFYVDEEDIEKLVGDKGFKVYMPRRIFDQDLTNRLYKKHFNYHYDPQRDSRINYYTQLLISSKSDIKYYKEICSKQVEKSKAAYEKREREKSVLDRIKDYL